MRAIGTARTVVSARIAFRGLARRPVRSAVTIGAIAFGVVALILTGGFIDDILSQLAEAVIRSQSGHIQIAPKGGFVVGSQRDRPLLIDRPEELKSRVSTAPGVEAAMARLMFSGVLSNGRRELPIVGEGVEPAAEARLGTYLRVISGRPLAADDDAGVLLGEGLAGGLALRPGDRVTVLTTTLDGATNSADLEVIGVFRTFSREYDARVAKLKLQAAQELIGAAGARRIVVALHRTGDTERVASLLESQIGPAGFELQTWRALNDFFSKSERLYQQQFGALRLIVLIMVLLSVTNNLNLMIFERTAEFGTMRALGDRGRRVFGQLMLEASALGLLGALAGVVLGCGLAVLISQIGIPMPPPPNANEGYVARISLGTDIVVSAALLGLIATLGGALLPALRVSRLPIHDALRRAGA